MSLGCGSQVCVYMHSRDQLSPMKLWQALSNLGTFALLHYHDADHHHEKDITVTNSQKCVLTHWFGKQVAFSRSIWLGLTRQDALAKVVNVSISRLILSLCQKAALPLWAFCCCSRTLAHMSVLPSPSYKSAVMVLCFVPHQNKSEWQNPDMLCRTELLIFNKPSLGDQDEPLQHNLPVKWPTCLPSLLLWIESIAEL